MKKSVHIFTMVFITLACLGTTGCKKGEDGKPGSANVTSQTYIVPAWASSSTMWYAQLPVSQITSENINSASIQVYWGINNNVWTALPYTYVASTNYFMEYLTAVGTIEVRWFYNSLSGSIGNAPNDVFGTTLYFKVVVIPAAAIKANPNLDLTNYKQVKEKFNL